MDVLHRKTVRWTPLNEYYLKKVVMYMPMSEGLHTAGQVAQVVLYYSLDNTENRIDSTLEELANTLLDTISNPLVA